MEAAESIPLPCSQEEEAPLTLVETPAVHTIEDSCSFLDTSARQSCKAVVYQKNRDDSYVVLFLRGDLDVNETKLTNYLGEEIHPARITPDCGLHAGYIGPCGLDSSITVLYDNSLKGAVNLSCVLLVGVSLYRPVHGTGLPRRPVPRFCQGGGGAICPSCKKTHPDPVPRY